MSELAKLQFEVHKDERGILVVNEQFPFEVKRVFWIYHTIGNLRGGHANRESDMLLTCQMGQLKLWIEHNGKRQEYHMRDSAYRALLIPKMSWIKFKAISQRALTLALCSKEYDETDYIREYKDYADEIQQS